MDSPVSARCAVLLALRARKASYAAALIEQIWEATSHRILLRDGSVYPLLKKLEEEGLVVECDDTAPRPGVVGSQGRYLGRPARLFTLTDVGRQKAEADAAVLLALLGSPDGESALTPDSTEAGG